MAKKKLPFFKKIISISTLIVIVMLVLCGRLVFLALSPEIDGINMSSFAKQRNMANIILPAKRGNIYDRHGLNLATSVSSYTVIAFLEESRTMNPHRPMHVVDKKMTAEVLAPLLNMEADYIYSLLNRSVYQVELGPGGRNITEMQKREIEALNLPGISFMMKPSRHYPNGDFASYIIGYAKRYEEVVVDNNLRRTNYNIVGELGIEGKFNEILNGVEGQLIYQRDRFGRRIPDTPQTRVEALDGNDIHLTIDSGIQRFLEAAVKDVNRVYRPEWIQISVLEAKTGRLLGSSTTPSYNPNLLNIVNYENPLISFSFEPGSTMKTFTYICAKEHGLYDNSRKYRTGSIQIFDQTISDWHRPGWGSVSLEEGFMRSSNAVAVELIRDLRPHELQECLLRYGFGNKTGIELPRELNGNLPFVNQVEKANAAFGQGLTTTGIQHLQALTMIANDGYMLQPFVIERIYDPNLEENVFEYEIQKEKVIDEEIANHMKELLYKVVHEEGGTGFLYRNNSFDIIGKTGTAQIVDPRTGLYITGAYNYIYSFAGMFPYDDPEIIIYAAMKKPTHGRHLGMVYAVDEIIENIGKYLHIGFERKDQQDLQLLEIDNYTNRHINDVIDKYEKIDLELIVIGDGDKVLTQSPAPNTILLPGDKVMVLTNGENFQTPNFYGWSRRHLVDFFELVEVEYEIEGFGFVISQNRNPAENLYAEELLKLKLHSKVMED